MDYKSINITYITNVRLPTSKAHGLQIMKSCEAFSNVGVTVKLITPRLKPISKENPFTYYGVSKNFILQKTPILELVPYEKWLGPLAGYIQNLSFSIVAIFLGTIRGWFSDATIIYTRDYMSAFCLTLFGYKPVIELHDYRSKNYRWRINYILRNAHAIIVNSEGTLSTLRSHYKIDDSKVLVVPNGVDIPFFNIPQSKDESREILGLPSGKNIIGYIGSLETVGIEKGIHTLINAFANLLDKYDDIILLIVGGPNDLIEEYKKEAASVEVPNDKIIFLGHVSYKKIPMFLRAIDIAVIPLPNNQFGQTTSPIKLFEYMAAGKTILASDLPSLRKYLGEQSAEFFEPSNPYNLVAHLKKLIDNPHLAKLLATNALNDSSKYTWEARANRILNNIYA